MNRHHRLAALKTIRALYAKVPSPNCKGLCVDQCGPLGMTTAEFDSLAGSTGKPPGVDAAGRCVYLVEGRCSVYRDRPLICRLYGATEAMPCPHGCQPARMLTRPEHDALIARAVAAGGPPKHDSSVVAYLESVGLGDILHPGRR